MNPQDKEYWDAKFGGIKAEINSFTEFFEFRLDKVIEPKIDEIIIHQKETNGKFSQVDEKTKFAQWIQSRPILSTVFFILSISVIIVVLNIIGLKEIIQLLK